MNKINFQKIVSLLLLTFLITTLGFSKVNAAAIEDVTAIDESKTYIIHAENEKVALYNSGGVNDGWIKQDKYLDFNKKFNWKFEKSGDKFYVKDITNNSYLTGESRTTNKSEYLDYVVTGVANDVQTKGLYELVKVQGGYLIKSTVNNKYLTYGIDRFYVTYTANASKAGVWKIEETPGAESIDSSKNYIMYNSSDSTALFDDGGVNTGWIRKTTYASGNKNFVWKFDVQADGSFYVKNVGRGYYFIGEGSNLNNISYLVSDKTTTAPSKGLFEFEKAANGYYLKSKVNNKYLRYGQNGTYVTFTDNKANALVLRLEEVVNSSYARPFNSTTLWETTSRNNIYRIPAIATANDGKLIAVSDLRYNGAGDLGNHQIDLLVKTSTDNGATWSSERNLTQGLSTPTSGYGDAAIVADRESDKVLILAAAGSKAFWHNTNKNIIADRANPLRVAKITSDNGGESFSNPTDITSKIYDLNTNWTRLFVTSGRIMQSRYVKVGDYYRIYAALLVGSGKDTVKLGNVVIYSDDFGDTWNVLGGKDAIPVPNGDEAKLEELPNGNVVITSRTETGRFVNIFTYNKEDNKFASGSWEDKHQKVTLGNGTYATNGELLVVYARDIKTNEYKYLALQSLPALNGGGIRKGVSIFYKELDPNETTVSEFITGWNTTPYIVQELYGGYSTMSLQKDGKIAFFFEDRYVNWAYDEQFVSLDLEAITLGKYEAAFTGIGSKASPYVVNTQEQLNAVNNVFNTDKEHINWQYNVSAEDTNNVVD